MPHSPAAEGRSGAAVRLAGCVAAVCVVLTLAGVGFALASLGVATPVTSASRRASTFQAVAFLALPLLGWHVVRRGVSRPVGWLLLGTGLSIAVWIVADGLALQSLLVAPGSWGGATVGVWAAWTANWVWVVGWSLVAFLFLLFPDGALPGPAWRPVAAVGGATSVVALVALALPAGPMEKYPWLNNPLGVVDVPAAPGVVGDLGVLPLVAFGVIAVTAIALRYRRARGIAQQQIRLLHFAATLVVALVAGSVVAGALGVRVQWFEELALVSTVLIPAAAGLAVLRYRLWDLGLVVRRTMVYSAVSTVIAGAFTVAAVVLGAGLRPLTTDSWPATVGSTLLAASLVGPVRRRLQRLIDRRFDRQRYDAARLVAEYRYQVRDEVDLEATIESLLGTVQAAVGPRTTAVWLPVRQQAAQKR